MGRYVSECGRLRSRVKADKFKHHAITLDELRLIFVAADATDIGPLVRVAAWTGSRLGELLALTWDDIDLDASRLNIDKSLNTVGLIGKPKTASGFRRISLSPETVCVLASLPRTSPPSVPVFADARRLRVDRRPQSIRRSRHPIP